jgi:hypothetical protein
MVRLAVALLTLLGPVADDWTKEKPDSIKKWLLNVQEVGAKYGKGSTKAETDLRIEALTKEFTNKFDGSVIEFRTRIREVKWKDGVATVTTQDELPLPKSPTAAMPFSFIRTPLEFDMDQEQATKIKPGDWLTFKGKLKFHPGKWGNVGSSTKSQQLYTLRHHFLGVGYLGTFTTTEYECQIDKVDVVEHWAEQAAAVKP